jgi:very-short-patch-repair endonuclease
MGGNGVTVEVQHAGALCYAMQQSAVPWLFRLALHNRGAEPLRDLRVTIALDGLLAPCTLHAAELAPGGVLELDVPDLPLSAAAFANVVERTRVDLVVTVDAAGERVAEQRSSIDVLAYNEWPGLPVLPALLAAFVAPNHPALAPLLQQAAARLQAATGRDALDGYQAGDPARVRAVAAAAYEVLAGLGVTYVGAPPAFEATGQKVRTPEQVVGERLGTCLDLALLYAALLEHAGLRPFVVLLQRHAFAGVWLADGSAPEVELGPAVELRKRADAGALLVVECTAACGGEPLPFAAAVASAARRLEDDDAFRTAIDVAAARRTGIRPLPVRTLAFAPGAPQANSPPGPTPAEHSGAPHAAPAGAPGGDEAPPPAPPAPPNDRLEHWKSKLLDLSLFNRLLNFVETKKTVRLCAHDLAALEDRLQQGGRVRVHPRPELGQAGDPRDLALASQRSGGDVLASYLAAELGAGRLRAEHDAPDLENRLVEIFRHARSSLEETGANTLFLAIGFLKWFETRESQKPRRSPLLLLPLVADRASVEDGVRFRLDDAEPRLNRTLLQFLQRDFELRVGLGETPPEGEIGVDVAAVLDAFRSATLALPRWEVEAAACIGFFSFSKHLMWLDLADRDALLQSPVLAHLVQRPGASFAQDVRMVERDALDGIDPATVFCPKDADSSQLAAVLAGANGRSFVLEGPPGTGKSQTIANLVAQALANGKRVLFVAEKRAALEVVQRRLADVGLGPFCLELHSSKTGAKAMLEQLRNALEVGQRREPAAWAKVAEQLQQARTRLNATVRDLHRVREHGVSVFGAVAALVSLADAKRFELPDVLAGGPQRVAAAGRAFDELAAAAAALGVVPAASPWWGVHRVDWRPAVAEPVAAAVARLQRAALALVGALPPVAGALALERVFAAEGPSRAQLAGFVELARLLRAPVTAPAAWLTVTDWRTLEADLARAVALGTQRDGAWAALAPRWRRELLGADLDALAVAYARSAEAFALLRWWRLRGPKAALAPLASGTFPAPTQVRDDLAAALRVRADERTLRDQPGVAAALGAAWRDTRADWTAVATQLQWARDVRRVLLQLAPRALAPDAQCLAAIARALDALAAGDASLPRALGAFDAAHDELRAAHEQLRALLELDDDEAFGPETEPGFLRRVEARTSRQAGALPALRDFCAWRAAADGACEHGAAPLVGAHARGELPATELPRSFRASWLRGWLDAVHAHEPALARFRGVDHERAIARFVELDRAAIRLAGDVVVARLAAQLPQLRDTTVASSELGILEREVKKQRKHKPPRRLFAEIPGLLGKLAPCMLMSPLSVAQFLQQRGGPRFDVVVFDEASQIPVWDAVSAIGRGDSLVVVGDSRQLPPTTFFQRLAQGDEPTGDDVPEDLESVLDECAVAGLPRMHLDWHYRSRHESLIAFSNHQYYRNRLLTFPAPQAVAAPGLGVRTVRVAGVYDRAGAQTNRVEAEALVAEVRGRLLDAARSAHSIGIVTFSQAQQVLVEDLLDQARRESPQLEAAFGAAVEPVFVKNLENVQGDERDVILFSIGYGPDAQGRVHENYGPLNLQGGERRLNVAVTRARRELVVFTSLAPEQVANRSKSVGAQHLRTFLDYALRGPQALAAAAAARPDGATESPFEDAVREALARRGHEVHAQIGCSGYRVDLAIVDRDEPGRYALGIECDGATWHSAATARDRDRLRAAVLRDLGWHLHRVWSTDWWLDAAGEVDRIERALAAAKVAHAAARAAASAPVTPADATPAPATDAGAADESAPPAPPSTAADAAVSARAGVGERADVADPDGPRPFVPAAAPASAGTPEDFAAGPALRTLRAQATALLQAEGPVVLDRLARTLGAAWGLTRMTNRVRERIRLALPPTALVRGEQVFADAAQANAFRGFRVPVPGDDATERAIEDVPAVELANAIVWLLRQHQALAADDLARETARCFGIARLGNVVRDTMNAAIEAVLAADRALRDGDLLRCR